jgi:hypothetical protein
LGFVAVTFFFVAPLTHVIDFLLTVTDAGFLASVVAEGEGFAESVGVGEGVAKTETG